MTQKMLPIDELICHFNYPGEHPEWVTGLLIEIKTELDGRVNNPNIKATKRIKFTQVFGVEGCTCAKCWKGVYRMRRRWLIFNKLVCDNCGIALGEKREYVSPNKADDKAIPAEEWKAMARAENNGFEEYKQSKGGRGTRPTTPRPPPPKGQG